MQKFRFILFSIITIIIVAVLGYWAFSTIEPGNIHVEREKQKQLEDKNAELQKENESLKKQLALLQPAEPDPQIVEEVPTEEVTEPTPKPATSKYKTLVAELQKLVDDKIYMKAGSRGTRVGTVQNFLNIYNGTSKKVDNDYGAGTKTDVMAFQKAEGLSVDGETGPNTYLKMIAWLVKNS